MGKDSDLAEGGRILDALRRERHEEWFKKNMDFLFKHCALTLTNTRNGGLVTLFRNEGLTDVDFFPSTGRWFVPSEGRTYGGGAEKFLRWYERRHKGVMI